MEEVTEEEDVEIGVVEEEAIGVAAEEAAVDKMKVQQKEEMVQNLVLLGIKLTP